MLKSVYSACPFNVTVIPEPVDDKVIVETGDDVWCFAAGEPDPDITWTCTSPDLTDDVTTNDSTLHIHENITTGTKCNCTASNKDINEDCDDAILQITIIKQGSVLL